MIKMRVRRIRNLTPHEIKIERKDIKEGETYITPTGQLVYYDIEDYYLHLPPGDKIARIEERIKERGEVIYTGGIEDIPVSIIEKDFGEIKGLPKEEDGVINIVSLPVCQALIKSGSKRRDIFAVGEIERDKEGKPYAAKNLMVCWRHQE